MCLRVCYHLKNLPVLFFFFFFSRASTTSSVCFTFCQWPFGTAYPYASVDVCVGLSVQMCISFYLCTHQSVSVCHALHFAFPCGSVCCAVRPSTLTSRCHLLSPDYLFNVCCHNQLQSFVTHDLRPFILSACYMPRELRPSDPNCLFIFPPTVSDRIHMLSGAALHTAPCLRVCWASYIMVRYR